MPAAVHPAVGIFPAIGYLRNIVTRCPGQVGAEGMVSNGPRSSVLDRIIAVANGPRSRRLVRRNFSSGNALSRAAALGFKQGVAEMGLLILLIVGGIVGWLASMIMRTDAQQGIILNVVVGIVGSFLAAFLLSPLLGIPPITSGAINIPTILISLLGAIVLLAIVNLVRRGAVR